MCSRHSKTSLFFELTTSFGNWIFHFYLHSPGKISFPFTQGQLKAWIHRISHWFFLQVIYILQVPFPDLVVMSLDTMAEQINWLVQKVEWVNPIQSIPNRFWIRFITNPFNLNVFFPKLLHLNNITPTNLNLFPKMPCAIFWSLIKLVY